MSWNRLCPTDSGKAAALARGQTAAKGTNGNQGPPVFDHTAIGEGVFMGRRTGDLITSKNVREHRWWRPSDACERSNVDNWEFMRSTNGAGLLAQRRIEPRETRSVMAQRTQDENDRHIDPDSKSGLTVDGLDDAFLIAIRVNQLTTHTIRNATRPD